MKKLSKKILAKLSTTEMKKLTKLKDKADKLFEKMRKCQADYVILSRKNRFDKRLPKMADKGFKYEKMTSDAYDKVKEFEEKMKIKYE